MSSLVLEPAATRQWPWSDVSYQASLGLGGCRAPSGTNSPRAARGADAGTGVDAQIRRKPRAVSTGTAHCPTRYLNFVSSKLAWW